MDFYLEVNEREYERIKNLDTSLGMALWNIAVLEAPIDTGNLRRAITLVSNSSKVIRIKYNLLTANYIHFLEQGYGPVKKHRGFIGEKTTINMIEEIINFIRMGSISSWLLGLPPLVLLRRSHSVFGYERKVMNDLGMRQKHLTANQRMKISSIRERKYQESIGGKVGHRTGQRVGTITQSRLDRTFAGRVS